jgi:hypothetical protein
VHSIRGHRFYQSPPVCRGTLDHRWPLCRRLLWGTGAGKDGCPSRTPAVIKWVACVGGGPGAFSRVEAQRCGSALRAWVVRARGPGLAAGSPSSASRRGAVREPRVLGGPAPERGNSSGAEAPARVGSREWAGGGEPEQRLADLDLWVHAPVPEVVIARVSGTVDRHTAPLLAQRVGQQLTRAPHVVGRGEITVLDPGGSGGSPDAASEGHRQREGKTPRRCRARRRAPRITGLGAVIAGFRAGPAAAAVLAAAESTGRMWMGCPVTPVAAFIQDIAGGGAAQQYKQGCGGSS